MVSRAYLSTGLSAGFVKDMSAGRGYIALAALIFAKWRPWQVLGACFYSDFLKLYQIGTKISKFDLSLPQFMQELPYILTVIILAGFGRKAIPPKAGGEPY